MMLAYRRRLQSPPFFGQEIARVSNTAVQVITIQRGLTVRTVICHYHIYKNSGTSFDSLLTQNFGDRHISFDGPFPFFTIDQEQLSRIIERKVNVVAFSSHQIQLPAPPSLEFNILPVVFLRHPLLRVLSIYRFKRKTFDGTPTSKAAQGMTFDEWISHSFSDRLEITHISNAQTRFLGSAYRQRPLMKRKVNTMEYDINQALRNLGNVKLLARTEYFDEDVSRFPKVLAQYEIDFVFTPANPLNVTGNDHRKSIEERIGEIRQLLSAENYQKLVMANIQDTFLYDFISSHQDRNKK